MNNTFSTPFRRTLEIATAGLLSLGLIACDQKPSAQKVGQDIDRAISQTGQQIAEAVDSAGAKMDKAGNTVADAAITARVKSALIAEPGLKSTGIDVVTEKGVVSLFGTTTSDASRERATTLAANVEGVKAVENNLAVVQGS